MLAARLDKNSLAGNRIIQILFEHRAIVNGEALQRVKAACSLALTASKAPVLDDLLRRALFQACFVDFEKRSSALGKITEPSGFKKVCLRLFNCLATGPPRLGGGTTDRWILC